MSDITDDIDVGLALDLVSRGKNEAPMATCPHDDEPLISTFEFQGAEFICQVCGHKYGFLSPKPAKWTPELQARHDELRAQYDKERAERQSAQ